MVQYGNAGRPTEIHGHPEVTGTRELVCACGARYRDLRTGLTYREVRNGLDHKWKRRATVLGAWHEIKLKLWRYLHDACG